MKRVIRVVVRFFAVAFIEGLSLQLAAWLVPGITLTGFNGHNALTAAMSVAVVLAILNGLVRPILILLTLPLSIFTLGFFTLFINAGILLLAAYALPYFAVSGLITALLGALILAAVNTVITSFTTIDDDYAFFDGVVQWLGRRQLVFGKERGRGLVMLEIDGLSYERARRAIESGLMPSLQQMVVDGTHALSPFDCGLPSQTSACQAGIMYGDNYDIPAFRWYEKDRGKLLVSNNFDDAAEINGRYANGNGLLRGGTSINNLIAGDARKALLTMSVLKTGPEEMERRNPEDLYLVFLNPYFFLRAITLTIWDIFVELYQGVRQRVLNVQPRINRLHKAYPLLRAITNVFLRDLSTYTVILDIIRGSPAIYTTYVGYDEIAHHAGPDTADAMNSVRNIDTQVRRILDVIKRKAPRPYDVILLSDHGQAYGATFKQRYGYTLTEHISSLMRQDATVAEVNATENAQGYTAALLAEVQAMEQNAQMGRVRGAAIERARKTLARQLSSEEQPAVMDTEVIVGVSGNLAHVYFDLHAGKVSMDELNAAYPNLLNGLVAHDGIGLVVSYEQDGDVWALSKHGARNLYDGMVTGRDPLLPYGDPDHRAAQLLRLAEFPHAGDLILISTVYEDGQVAAFEELVGSHGGLGGQQTSAFLFHPADMEVPPTSSATDVFALLNARRNLHGEPLRPQRAPDVESWSWATWAAGLRDVSRWATRALRALRLERQVFSEVANDPYATGPALLLLFFVSFVSALVGTLGAGSPETAVIQFIAYLGSALLAWFFVIILALMGGRVLRSRSDFTRTMRALAYAQAPQVLVWLRVVPFVGALFATVGWLMVLLASWLALQEALHLRRITAALIPLIGLVVLILSAVVFVIVLSGLGLTAETVWRFLNWR